MINHLFDFYLKVQFYFVKCFVCVNPWNQIQRKFKSLSYLHHIVFNKTRFFQKEISWSYMILFFLSLMIRNRIEYFTKFYDEKLLEIRIFFLTNSESLSVCSMHCVIFFSFKFWKVLWLADFSHVVIEKSYFIFLYFPRNGELLAGNTWMNHWIPRNFVIYLVSIIKQDF